MKIMIVSNGKGEDSIAVTLYHALCVQLKSSPLPIEWVALPCVGDGQSYLCAGIRVVGTRKTLPSGGFGHQRFSALWQDVRAGLLGLIGLQYQSIKKERPDWILAVGDIFPVLLGQWAQTPVIHVGTAYSVFLRTLWPIERAILRRCVGVFPRDKKTAIYQEKYHIPTYYYGNIMMDDPLLSATDHELSVQINHIKNKSKVIALIPSSRDDAYENLEILLRIAQKMTDKNMLFLIAQSPRLSAEKISARIAPFQNSLSLLTYTGALGNVIHACDVAMGMTGTGNEQVAGLGKPMILLQGSGPQSTSQRLHHYEKLLGTAVCVPKGSVQEKAKQIESLVFDTMRCKAMGCEGMARMGHSGGTEKIAEHIVRHIFLPIQK